MARTYKAARSSDFRQSYIFPQGTDVTGYTGTFTIYTEQNGTSLLAVTGTPNLNSSSLSFDANIISVVIKNADIIALPTDAADTENPSVLFFDLAVLTSAGDLVKVDGGAFIVYPYGASPVQNWGDLTVLINGQNINVEIAATGFDTSVLNTVNDAAAAADASATEAAASASAANTSAYNADQSYQAVEDLFALALTGPFISYTGAQSLTNTQKALARSNISAYAIYNIPTTTTDYSASVAAFLATTTANTVRQANTAQKPLFFPTGVATGGTNAVIALTGAGQTVAGAGRASVLTTTGVDINEFNTSEIRDLFMIGAGDYGIRMRTTTGRVQIPNISNMFIQDKTVGIRVDAASTTASVAYGQISNSTLFLNGTGLSLTNAVNFDLTGVQVISSTYSDYTQNGGGEVKHANNRFQGGGAAAVFNILGTASNPAVESYYTNVNMNQGGNLDLVACTITPYASGSQILVDTSPAAHKCTVGWSSFNLTSANYGTGVTWVVANVLSTTQVVLQIGTTAQAPGTYTVSESGTFNRQFPGLNISADSMGNANDLFFHNCASNNTEINNAFNVIYASRGMFSKQRVWLTGTNNRLLSIGSSRGRDGLSTAGAGDILPGGPSSHTGWSHLGIIDPTATRSPGGVFTGALSPMKNWGVGSNNMSAGYAFAGTTELGPRIGIMTYGNYATMGQHWDWLRPTTGDQIYMTATDSVRMTSDDLANGLEIFGAASGSSVRIAPYGSDTNIPLRLSSKGAQSVDVYTGTSTARQFRVIDTAGATEYIQVTGGSSIATVQANGASSVIALQLRSTGAGSAVHLRGGGTSWLTAIGGSSTVDIGAYGSDTNSDITISPKGTGVVKVGYGASNNHLVITPATAGSAPNISAAGTDTNIALRLYSKGTQLIGLFTGTTPSCQLNVIDTAGATTYVQINGGSTGARVTVNGTDVNSRLDLQSQGTGIVSLRSGGGTRQIQANDTGIGFNGSVPVAKGTITGSRSSGAALASLLTYLASRGDIIDSTAA